MLRKTYADMHCAINTPNLSSKTNNPHFFSESAKIYYATLRIINGAGRPAVLKPNRGNDDGFPIKPNSTQQIVLMSMSTDNNPIEPVAFHAIDAETSTKLMINHFIRPFVVVPKESKKELTPILVTSPGMQVCPIFKTYFVNVYTVFTRLSAAALFKFSELQMRRSFGGGAQSGAALFKKTFICEL
jgi:hypothetical protein